MRIPFRLSAFVFLNVIFITMLSMLMILLTDIYRVRTDAMGLLIIGLADAVFGVIAFLLLISGGFSHILSIVNVLLPLAVIPGLTIPTMFAITDTRLLISISVTGIIGVLAIITTVIHVISQKGEGKLTAEDAKHYAKVTREEAVLNWKERYKKADDQRQKQRRKTAE